MLRLFLDANIVASGLLFRGPESEILLAAERGAFTAVTTTYVLDQVRRVLIAKFGPLEADVISALRALPVEVVDPPTVSEIEDARALLRDPSDAPVLAAAWAAASDGLVTGDLDLHAVGRDAGIPILRAAGALRLLARSASSAPEQL